MATEKDKRVVICSPSPMAVIAERTHLSGHGHDLDQTWEETVYLYLAVDNVGDRWMVVSDEWSSDHELVQLTPTNLAVLRKRSWVVSHGERGGRDRLIVPLDAVTTFLAAHGLAKQAA